MSKLLKSFLKYIKRKPSFKDIILCSALLLLAISLMMFSDKIFDENVAPVGTMLSLGIVILVGIVAVRNKQKDSRNVISSLFVSCEFRQRFLLKWEFLNGNLC